MKILPIANRILVKRDEEKKMSAGGLHLPETANKDEALTGTVIAAGEGVYNQDGIKVRPLLVAENHRVIFGKYAGTIVKVEDVEYILMQEDDILGRVEE